MTLSLTFITSWFLPSLFTPSVTLPCEPVTAPGHVTVLTTVRETVFAIESWRTLYEKDCISFFFSNRRYMTDFLSIQSKHQTNN